MLTYSKSKEFSSGGKINKSKSLKINWHSLFLWPILVLLLIIGLTALPKKDYVLIIITWIQNQGHMAWLWISLFYALACLFFLPKTIIALTSGYLFGMEMGFITGLVGCILGATPTFFIGRFLSDKLQLKHFSRNTNFIMLSDAVKKNGFKIILLCRLNPIFPFGVLNYISGATKIRFPEYLIASIIGFIPMMLIYVYIGQTAQSFVAAFSGNLSMLSTLHYYMLAIVIMTLIVTILTVHIMKKTLLKNSIRHR